MKNLNPSDLIDLKDFTKICMISALKENEGKRFIINDTDVAVFKVDGEIYALSNICPHQHTALIYDGFIEDGCVVCPAHGWMFDLQTGLMPTKQKGLDSFPTKIVEDVIYVKVNKKELKW
jgi:3-phenylpropionate/trans-cinnamate dioxygenase ferredoxin component